MLVRDNHHTAIDFTSQIVECDLLGLAGVFYPDSLDTIGANDAETSGKSMPLTSQKQQPVPIDRHYRRLCSLIWNEEVAHTQKVNGVCNSGNPLSSAAAADASTINVPRKVVTEQFG